MTGLFCDLHTHSNCSDGSNTPEEIVELAEKAGLGAVALCDHNTVAGLSRFRKAALGKKINAVLGTEVTCAFRGKEVHIVGLFIKPESLMDISTYLLEINIRKIECNEILTERLQNAGYSITYDEVLQKAAGGFPNRVHFANVLMDKGYIESIKQAFDTILSDSGGFYRPAEKLDAFEVIEFLCSVEAVPVLAHPLLNLSEDELCEFLPEAKARGLIAMECLYSTFSENDTALAFELADKFGLMPSGGSDYHGANKPDIELGFGKGTLEIPIEIYNNLAKASHIHPI